jgi:hypothetical protein
MEGKSDGSDAAAAEAVGADPKDTFTLAIFPKNQYLSDPMLQKAVIELAKSGNLKQADSQALLPFHPMGVEVLKQKPDQDVYFLLGVYGNLGRHHVVATNGISRTNPPPDDYLCDLCHTKGWLKKSFQESKIDGANIAVWLCPDCSKLEPEKRDVRS